jgi:sulfur transfer complex TusBCD TusB component (DsrH family)
MRDDEGYTCVKWIHEGHDIWVISDRFSRTVEGEKTYYSYEEARKRADIMNDDVIARRLADSMRKQ